jgi:hypothetical protein
LASRNIVFGAEEGAQPIHLDESGSNFTEERYFHTMSMKSQFGIEEYKKFLEFQVSLTNNLSLGLLLILNRIM